MVVNKFYVIEKLHSNSKRRQTWNKTNCTSELLWKLKVAYFSPQENAPHIKISVNFRRLLWYRPSKWSLCLPEYEVFRESVRHPNFQSRSRQTNS